MEAPIHALFPLSNVDVNDSPRLQLSDENISTSIKTIAHLHLTPYGCYPETSNRIISTFEKKEQHAFKRNSLRDSPRLRSFFSTPNLPSDFLDLSGQCGTGNKRSKRLKQYFMSSQVASDPGIEQEPSNLSSSWKESDVEQLKIEISQKNEFLWNTLKKIKDPENLEITIEILEQIETLKESIPNQKVEELINITLQFTALDDKNRAHKLLGTLLYQLDKKSTECLEMISTEHSLEAICLKLEDALKELFNNMASSIEEHALKQHKLGIQDPLLSKKIKLPHEIAKILITRSGFLNYPLIDPIINFFVVNKCTPLNHEYTLMKGLKLLRRPQPLRSNLLKIKKPSYSQSLANHLIRIQMGYRFNDPITDRDAEITALTALLSHLRQGPVGSCFATHFAIVLLSTHLRKCLEDFSSLLSQGKLVRNVNNIKKEFPFLLRTGDSSTRKNITLSTDGMIIHDNGEKSYLWEAPGIIAVCRAIGLENPQEAIKTVIANKIAIQESSHKSCISNIDTLIQALSKHQVEIMGLPKNFKTKLYTLATFAFETQTRNGLQSAWENSIAEMAEGKEGGMIKRPILHSICKPLKRHLETTFKDSESLNSIIDSIRARLLKHIHLHYDPHIYNDSIDSEHHSSEGGYVIYDINRKLTSTKWIRIETPDDFKKFILRILKLEKKILTPTEATTSSDSSATLYRSIKKYVSKGSFVQDAMHTFCPKYRTINDLIENWTLCQHTPWRTLSGNIAQHVREVYMEDMILRPTASLLPKSGKDLLEQLILLIKKLNLDDLKKLKDNPYLHIPLITPTHAFSLLPGHLSLLQAVMSKRTPEEWIKLHVLVPGKAIANTPISDETAHLIKDFVAKQILSKEEENTFLTAASTIPSSLSIRKFHKTLIRLIETEKKCALTDKEKFRISSKLCFLLPEDLQKKLKLTAVHFADTNWHEEIYDINLCIAVNPCSGKLSILEILDNGMKIRPVKEFWLLNKPWEYYLNPEIVLPPITPVQYKKHRNCDHSEEG